jgi:hypothetical protein
VFVEFHAILTFRVILERDTTLSTGILPGGLGWPVTKLQQNGMNQVRQPIPA